MKPTYEELEHIACEMSQQDWSDLRFADVYYDAFVAGGKWFIHQYEELERERNELAARVGRLRESVEVLMANSHGVAGLHLNGDIASWGELTEGGRFEEWLLALSEQPPAALAALKAQWQAEAVRDFEAMLSSFPVTAKDWIEKRAQKAGDV